MKRAKTDINLMEQKAMPYDTETEWSVLSTLMRYNEKLAEFEDILDVGMFYYEKERAMFKCITGVIHEGNTTDVNSLYNYAKSHDVGYDIQRNDFIEIISNLNKVTIRQDIMRLRDMKQRREYWRMLQEFAQSGLDMTCNVEDEIDNCVSAVSRLRENIGTNDVANMGDALEDVNVLVNENQQGRSLYYRTGLRLFDEYFLLRPGTMTVIAAFTSVGKSALALNIVEEVARQDIACAYYSLEMGKGELAARMISGDVGVPASVIMNRKLSENMLQSFHRAMGNYKSLPVYFDDRSTVDFNRTMRSIRTLVKTKDVKLVVIDYLQIFAQVKEDEEESISYMARTCKNVARETGVCVILLSQLNRSLPHPSIKMLRGSGQIEESADNVVLIDRPEAYPDNKVKKYEGEFHNASIEGTAKLILAKGRGVGTCNALVQFIKKETRFREIAKPEDNEYREQEEPMPF